MMWILTAVLSAFLVLAPTASKAQLPTAQEDLLWPFAKNCTNKDAVLLYLQHYPNGKYADQAKACLEPKKPEPDTLTLDDIQALDEIQTLLDKHASWKRQTPGGQEEAQLSIYWDGQRIALFLEEESRSEQQLNSSEEYLSFALRDIESLLLTDRILQFNCKAGAECITETFKVHQYDSQRGRAHRTAARIKLNNPSVGSGEPLRKAMLRLFRLRGHDVRELSE